jgi:cation diffusion facilitator CzcD-associated flavoprotein CzcO
MLSDPQPTYCDVDKLWTVHVGQPNGGVRIVRCRHIVLATGVFGPPVIPVVPGAESFGGELLHASKFYSGAKYAGKRVLVVGGGNTAADVCQDLRNAGAAQVTMLQRSSSCVLLANTLAAGYAAAFPAGMDVGLMDFQTYAVPWRVRERLLLKEREERIARGEDPDVHPDDVEQMRQLKETGFQVNYGRDGLGLPAVVVDRLGGMRSSFCMIELC